MKILFIILLLAITCLYFSFDVKASFDRVRIVITSSSDWTILSIKDNSRIINAKAISLQGSTTQSWTPSSLSVNQPLDNALKGQSVQAQFDIILKSESLSMLSFESTKGGLGIVQIDFYNYNKSTPKLIDTVKNTITGGHPNPKAFTIDAVKLLEGDFEYSRSDIQKLVLAFYYPWYYLDSWKVPYLLDKPLIPYSSDDVSTIYHHVYLAKQSGIDGFISSWWGPNDYTDKNLQKLLSIAESMNFKVSIYFETLTGDPPGPRSESEILSWMRYFIQTYGKDKRFMQFNGKPVIFVWATATVPANTWEKIFKTIRNEGYDAFFIADTLDLNYLPIFDGLHTYGPTGTDEIFKQVEYATKTYGWLDNKPQLKIWCATAQPGYDDTILPGRQGFTTDRANGKTYIKTYEASLNTQPDWLLISTFNEWWENTHIEPSQNYGDLYLELTAKYADIYKGLIPRPPVNFSVPTVSEPDGTVKLTWDKPYEQNPESYNIYRDIKPIYEVSKPAPLIKGVKGLSYIDLPPSNNKYYYAITAVLGNKESPITESLSTISHRNKSKADPSKEIPIDIAIYVESTSWILESDAKNEANIIIQSLSKKVNDVRIVSQKDLPEWVLSHIKNSQPDIIILFGDFPDSIYPSGNQNSNDSLAELFLDDGNIFLNTGDYIFYGKGRNGTDGLINMMDIPTTMWGDNTSVKVTESGRKFTLSLKDFVTDRPFHLNELLGSDWESEIIFADNGSDLADPVIVKNRKTGGRIGIIFQTAKPISIRGKVISEIILNWLPNILSMSLWDINKDGKVNIGDLEIVKLNFGKKFGQISVNNADINGDGIVNIIDLVLVVIHFDR